MKDRRVYVNIGFTTPPYGILITRDQETVKELVEFVEDYTKNCRTRGIVHKLFEIGISREEIEQLIKINQKELEKQFGAGNQKRDLLKKG